MKRAKPDWTHLREELWTRSGGFCEVTGVVLDFETFDAHHRRNKQMGGTYRPDTDTLPNLIAVDPLVHNGTPNSIHQNPAWSRPRGYLLHAVAVPIHAPILYRGHTWSLLPEDGPAVPMTGRQLRDVEEAFRLNQAPRADGRARLGQYRR